MRIRTQIIAAVLASLSVGLGSLGIVLMADRQSDAASEAQQRAQITAHEVAGLLTLTHAYARSAAPGAALQWHQRHATVVSTLNEDPAGVIGSTALTELRSLTGALPTLFGALEALPPATDAAALRRKEQLVDQLLASTQAMSDHAYQWFVEADRVHQREERRFRLTAFSVTSLMFAFLIAMALLVRQRVLLPMKRLQAATRALGAGDMGHRIDSTAKGEWGDLARQFDSMSATLSQSRDRLQSSERQLRAITDNVPALICCLDRDHRYGFANAAYLDAWGLRPEEVLGLHVSDVVGHENYQRVRGHIDAALSGERQSWTGTVMTRGSSEVYHLVQSIPDHAPDGTVQGCYVMAVDIADRHEAENRLAKSERQLVDLLNSIPAMVGYFDMDEQCQYANDTGLKMQGLQRSQIAGLSLRAALGDANYAQHEPYVKEVLQGRRARFQGKIPFQGRTAWFQAHLIPDRLEGGAQRGFYLMTFDVTALKEAQFEQAKVEGRLRAITDNLPVLITYVDAESRYRFINRTSQDWMSIAPEMAMGRTVGELLPPELYEQRRPYLERALQGERVTFEMESPMQGVLRHLQATYIPDIQPDGRVAGIYALSTDVSPLKQVEKQLSKLVRVDTLTGVANRYQFNESLPMALMRGERSGMGVALMFLDVDHFKVINDTHGHAVGDGVLQEFACRLKLCVRATDTVARYAGDEFVILLEGVHHESQPELMAQKVLSHIERPFQVSGITLNVSTSVGVAYCSPKRTSVHTLELLARADKALYDAKRAGRNTFRMAEPVT